MFKRLQTALKIEIRLDLAKIKPKKPKNVGRVAASD
jgi:hypothetical protein